MRKRQRDVAPTYAAFFFGFIFPAAQRCFSSRDSFLRAAALIRPGLLWVAAAGRGERTALRWPVELMDSSAEIARSMRSRSVLSSANILLVSIK